MNLGEALQKANLSNLMIIGSIVIAGVTAFNQIDANKNDNKALKTYAMNLEVKYNQQQLELIEHRHKIKTIEGNVDKFDTTLTAVNSTLSELNATISGLKSTVDAINK
ncbi:hypothetical protein [Vibrio vulnificus]|uniref:hypothetical protein n=1 Tax=Vibrio vulnificus TaxID=672 RepID=UPI0032424E36